MTGWHVFLRETLQLEERGNRMDSTGVRKPVNVDDLDRVRARDQRRLNPDPSASRLIFKVIDHVAKSIDARESVLGPTRK